jgi:hypothetical protein
MKLTKELVESVNDGSISKNRYDDIISCIGDRVDVVWRLILRLSNRKLHWYSFSNDVETPGGGSTGGDYDPKADSEFIELIGDFSKRTEDRIYKFNYGFPTRFLWMENSDIEKEVILNLGESSAGIKVERNRVKQQKSLDKEHRSKIIKQIRSKLSPAELKFVTFK